MDTALKLATEVVEKLRAQKLFITTVESCTGGGVVDFITNVAGASEVLTSARVLYSPEEKIAFGVPENRVNAATIYSEETAIAMAMAGVKKALRADVGVGITGHISSPDPEGKNGVYIAVVFGEVTKSEKVIYPAGCKRWAVKRKVIEKTFRMILEIL